MLSLCQALDRDCSKKALNTREQLKEALMKLLVQDPSNERTVRIDTEALLVSFKFPANSVPRSPQFLPF
jgi:hypothetical protein